MNQISPFIILSILLITASTSSAARPDDSFDPGEGNSEGDYAASSADSSAGNAADSTGGDGILGDIGDRIDDFSSGSIVCREEGPCYMMKLTCPQECYKNIDTSGNGFEGSAGGGGCTMDCKERCIATC